MTPCRSKIPDTGAEYQAEIRTNMHKLHTLVFFYMESSWRHAMWWKQFSSTSSSSESYRKAYIAHFLYYQASVLILLNQYLILLRPWQALSPTMLCTLVEIMVSVYSILQFLHSELGHFEAGESRGIEENSGDGNFLLYLTPSADLCSLENFQLLQEIWDCSF